MTTSSAGTATVPTSEKRRGRLAPGVYLRICVLTPCLVLFCVAALNLAIDPQLVWGSPLGPGFLANRTEHWEKTLKAELLRRAHPEVLLIGSSRVENGIDPTHPAWGGKRVFNGGLAGADIKQTRLFLDYAFKVARPKEVVLCVEFDLFNDLRLRKLSGIPKDEAATRGPSEIVGLDPDHVASPLNPNLDWVGFYISNAIGRGATTQSISLLTNRYRGVKGVLRPDGMRISSQPTSYEGSRKMIFKSFNEFFFEFENHGWASSEVESMARACRLNSAKLTLIIPPLHAEFQACIEVAGLWREYEDWKRTLVEMTERDRAAGGSAELWDCSGFGGPLSEPLPTVREPLKTLRWHFEVRHFTKLLGDQVIADIYAPRPVLPSEGGNPEQIAFKLIASNLEGHLTELRRGRDDYAARNPLIMATLRSIRRNVQAQRSWRVSIHPE